MRATSKRRQRGKENQLEVSLKSFLAGNFADNCVATTTTIRACTENYNNDRGECAADASPLEMREFSAFPRHLIAAAAAKFHEN